MWYICIVYSLACEHICMRWWVCMWVWVCAVWCNLQMLGGMCVCKLTLKCEHDGVGVVCPCTNQHLNAVAMVTMSVTIVAMRMTTELHKHGSSLPWLFTTMALHCHGSSLPWLFTAMALHRHGSSLPWLFTAMALHCHGSSLPWLFTAMALHRHGSSLPWLFTAMALHCHGSSLPWLFTIMALHYHGSSPPWWRSEHIRTDMLVEQR